MSKIEIFEYDSKWPEVFQKQSSKIHNCLGANCLEIHHFGSTSIEGMVAKRDIDILCVVQDLNQALKLEEIGYKFRGEHNVPLRYGFSKNREEYKVNLHVVLRGNNFISLNLKFRDYLRLNPSEAKKYSVLKRKLIEDPQSHIKNNAGFSMYNLGKNLFIKDILLKAGFNDLVVNHTLHDREWVEYHRIRKAEIFNNSEFEYDPHHPTISAKNHFHFVLYKGINIVSVAHIEFIDNSFAVLRPFATDGKHHNKGYGSYMLRFLESWMKNCGVKTIKLHAYNNALNFYKNRGYIEMNFDEESMFEDCTDMGKYL